jgi:hypothetical protein
MSGETIAIAGLIKTEQGNGSSGFPYLSRIPVIGALFGNQTVRDNRKEILVLITPTVVRDPMEARRMTDEYGTRFRALEPLRKQQAQGAGSDAGPRCTVLVPVQAPAPGSTPAWPRSSAACRRRAGAGRRRRLRDPRVGALAAAGASAARWRALPAPRAPLRPGRATSRRRSRVPRGDVVLLRCDAEATPGLAAAPAAARAATRASPRAAWSGETNWRPSPMPAAPARGRRSRREPATGRARPRCRGRGPALYLRREAVRALGGLDTASLSRMGRPRRPVPARRGAGLAQPVVPGGLRGPRAEGRRRRRTGEIERLQMRWPDFQERVARFILEDPLRPLRERLRARIAELARGGPQLDLFGN